MYTNSQFKLVLCLTSRVIPSRCVDIPHYVLQSFGSEKIKNYKHGLNYLVDVKGVVTDIYYQSCENANGVVETTLKVKLADSRGHYDCILLGDYDVQLRNMMYEASYDVLVLVLQFVKIKSKQGLFK
ncbi:hypothetical protein TSUD_63650 [Trifolium subterraneum]|uniref:Replication factor A C-terminal domain-containing protein n=1 Tax=Trifolium subterraneum TaxID=3900 RepID=A0A2Z6MG16_TRISU|nr:hypothetical protein TSUD_63650 [Trifolium subterraneum]